jgi:cytochrome c biogenesis protein ResB
LDGAYRVVLKNYEKASSAHTLTVDKDPGRVPTYFGFVMLFVALASMLCFSHQRVWAIIKPDGSGSLVSFSGDANRHSAELRPRFEALTEAAIGAIRRWTH